MKNVSLLTDWLPMLVTMTDESKGKLFHSIMVFADSGTLTGLDGIPERDEDAFKTLYYLITRKIVSDMEHSAEKSELSRKAGKASGIARRSKIKKQL